ncbi:MAG: hypothetical protein K2X82_24440 [Gemmataceae bacterium]|nr:hypothetical protein [Gemmataceae bacterium]
MRRWMAAPLVFAAAAAVAVLCADAPPARAADPVEETFPTADGVRLKGLFHRADKAREGNPVVVLLYSPGPDRTMLKGDWDGLAATLNKQGFHVFRFDWRGHGKSTDIQDPQEFWKNPLTGPWNNKYIKGAAKKPVKNELAVKADVNAKYFPAYVNDLAAVRTYLDQKNDEGAFNSSSIYLIGEKDAAALGMLWMAAEWERPAIAPLLGNGIHYKVVPTRGVVADPEAGKDIAGAIWLSGSRGGLPEAAIKTWAQNAPRLRDNNPMLFLYGEKDPAASAGKTFVNEVLVAGGNKNLGVKKLEQTFLVPVPNSKTLTGVSLLGKNADLQTEDTIVKYLTARQKDRASITRKERRYVSPYYVDLSYFGLRPQ